MKQTEFVLVDLEAQGTGMKIIFVRQGEILISWYEAAHENAW